MFGVTLPCVVPSSSWEPKELAGQILLFVNFRLEFKSLTEPTSHSAVFHEVRGLLVALQKDGGLSYHCNSIPRLLACVRVEPNSENFPQF